jgi:hypothetical protein
MRRRTGHKYLDVAAGRRGWQFEAGWYAPKERADEHLEN